MTESTYDRLMKDPKFAEQFQKQMDVLTHEEFQFALDTVSKELVKIFDSKDKQNND